VKANKLTNLINILLNEDKLSKYTALQILDELGPEDFLDYLDDLFSKTIKKEAPKFFKGMTLKTKDIDFRNSVTITYRYLNLELIMSWVRNVHEGGWGLIVGRMNDLKGSLLLETDGYDFIGVNISPQIQSAVREASKRLTIIKKP
jgi:hypothetical protein